MSTDKVLVLQSVECEYLSPHQGRTICTINGKINPRCNAACICYEPTNKENKDETKG